MKTKLILLAAVLLAGIATSTSVVGRDTFYNPVAPKTTVADKPATKDHCDMSGMSGMSHGGGMCAMDQMPAMSGKCDMPEMKSADKGMACHTGAPAARAHKGCCN
jgi:hypothetical protein